MPQEIHRNFFRYAHPVLDAIRKTVNPSQISFVQPTELALIGMNAENLPTFTAELSRVCEVQIPLEQAQGWRIVQDVCDTLAQLSGKFDPRDDF